MIIIIGAQNYNYGYQLEILMYIRTKYVLS